ncbi:MAG: YHS domain-containing protein [Candidatus Sulfobium sp.]|jgi:Cu+-exporting ATPase
MKVKDPVCNMTIEESEAAGNSTYKGDTYYFCSKGCQETFDKNPEAFVAKKGS